MLNIIKRLITFLLIGVVFIALQAGLRNIFSPYEWLVPNLFIALVIYLGFHEINLFGSSLAFLLGLELDLASGNTFGPWAAAFVALFGVLALVAKRIFIESYFTLALTIFCATLFVNLIYFALAFQSSLSSARSITGIFIEGIVTGIIAPLVIFSLGRSIKKIKILPNLHAHR